MCCVSQGSQEVNRARPKEKGHAFVACPISFLRSESPFSIAKFDRYGEAIRRLDIERPVHDRFNPSGLLASEAIRGMTVNC